MSKDDITLDAVKKKLNSKYNRVDFHEIVDNQDGSHSFVVSGDSKGFLNVLNNSGSPSFESLPQLDVDDVDRIRKYRGRTSASTITRDPLSNTYLDLPVTPSVINDTPSNIYKRSMEYYKSEDVYGSSIDLLSNFAAKGFVNDTDDENIRSFYDNWVIDTGFDKIVEQLFFEYFRSGFVRTYKVVSKYIPKVNYLSSPAGQTTKEKEDVASLREKALEEAKKAHATFMMGYKARAAKKIKWSKDYMPIRYTVLNPTMVEVETSSVLVDQQLVTLKAEALKSLKDLLEKSGELTEHQKLIIKSIPSDMKASAQDGKDLPLDPYLVGAVDYRRQPYETYPLPRGARSFESMEYKRALRNADYSTLDGITNYLLVITVGSDTNPVKTQDVLETVSDLFDTPSKAYDVVWDHTLKVQRIEPQEIGEILGQEKYKQVNDDITGAFGVIRALIDGVGNPSVSAAGLAVKALVEEIHHARKEVSRWIYKEYRDVAEAMAFEKYPKVRFDDMILKDEIQMMSVIQGMIDRRIITYRTGHELLGLDHDTLKAEFLEEMPLVIDGTFGIIGSPYNPKLTPFAGDNVQKTQRAPKGTPSEGRPPGKPAKQTKPSEEPKAPKVSEASLDLAVGESLNEMTIEEMSELLQYVKGHLLDKIERDRE